MKTKNTFSHLIVSILFAFLLTGCRAVQPILVLKTEDLFWLPFVYLILCFVFAKALSINNNKFWLWFTLCLVLTPVAGLIALIYRIGK